ncbi:MAG: YqaE/Pmp3 family membrane protein [Bacteroidota bacterium]
MKKLTQMMAVVCCLVLLNGAEAKAAFPIKQEIVTTVQNQQNGNTLAEAGTTVKETKVSETTTLTKKRATAKAIPQGLYIVLAIFYMGWLAMGINDDFHGNDWLISLLLYIIFYIPGLIYTLVKMNKYY